MIHARIAAVETLDNPVWHSLVGPHARFAQHKGPAVRYQPDVTPFAALPDEPDDDAWAALAELTGPEAYSVLFRAEVDPPEGWEVTVRFPTLQMVASRPAAEGGRENVVPLGQPDVAEMLELVGRTVPGPFFERTIELGTYLGIRDGRRLVAMAGERMRLEGFVEISAVCTDADRRGRGLARSLVSELVTRIETTGATPVLHVLADNASAIRLYERLGFAVRREFNVAVVHRRP
jgi:ribosomal protein S18 acetylase RimI-like enzyme